MTCSLFISTSKPSILGHHSEKFLEIRTKLMLLYKNYYLSSGSVVLDAVFIRHSLCEAVLDNLYEAAMDHRNFHTKFFHAELVLDTLLDFFSLASVIHPQKGYLATVYLLSILSLMKRGTRFATLHCNIVNTFFRSQKHRLPSLVTSQSEVPSEYKLHIFPF